MNSYYTLLGLPEDASAELIEQRYLELTQFLLSKAVPPHLKEWATGQLPLLDEAFGVLRDPVQRQEYDREHMAALRGGPSGRGGEGETPSTAPSPSPLQRAGYARAREAVAKPGPWWKGGMLLFSGAGLVVGLGVVLVVAAGTGDWDRIEGLFGGGGQGVAEEQGDDLNQALVKQWMGMVERDPSDQEALFQLGEIHFEGGSYENAIYWFNRLLEVDSQNAHALNDLGLASSYLGRNDQALDYWERALEVEPDNVYVHYSMGFFFLNTPPFDWDAARRHFQEVVDLAPGTDIAQSAQSHVDAIEASAAAGG